MVGWAWLLLRAKKKPAGAGWWGCKKAAALWAAGGIQGGSRPGADENWMVAHAYHPCGAVGWVLHHQAARLQRARTPSWRRRSAVLLDDPEACTRALVRACTCADREPPALMAAHAYHPCGAVGWVLHHQAARLQSPHTLLARMSAALLDGPPVALGVRAARGCAMPLCSHFKISATK